MTAQAIEARSGETGTGSTRQGESAVPQGMRPRTYRDYMLPRPWFPLKRISIDGEMK